MDFGHKAAAKQFWEIGTCEDVVQCWTRRNDGTDGQVDTVMYWSAADELPCALSILPPPLSLTFLSSCHLQMTATLEISAGQWRIDVTYSPDVAVAITIKSSNYTQHGVFRNVAEFFWHLKMIRSVKWHRNDILKRRNTILQFKDVIIIFIQ